MKFKWEHAKNIEWTYRAIDRCEVEKEYYDTVSGQEVKITRYSYLGPKEQTTIPCTPQSIEQVTGLIRRTGKVGK